MLIASIRVASTRTRVPYQTVETPLLLDCWASGSFSAATPMSPKWLEIISETLGLMTVCEVLLCVLRFGKTAAAPELMWRQKKHHAQHHQFRVSHSFYAYSGQQSNPAAADLKTSSFLSNSDHTFDFHYIDR